MVCRCAVSAYSRSLGTASVGVVAEMGLGRQVGVEMGLFVENEPNTSLVQRERTRFDKNILRTTRVTNWLGSWVGGGALKGVSSKMKCFLPSLLVASTRTVVAVNFTWRSSLPTASHTIHMDKYM